MEQSVAGAGVLDKVVTLLDALVAGPASLGELTAATGLPRATVHRLAVALERHGMVARDAGGRFRLGAHLVPLGHAAARDVGLGPAVRPVLEALRDETGESVQLYVRDGATRVCVAALESPHGLRTIVPTGAVLPLGRGSAGRLLDDGGAPGPGGWLATHGEREAGVASVSAPVTDPSGATVAAIGISGPSDRLGPDAGTRFGPAVVAAAASLAAALAP